MTAGSPPPEIPPPGVPVRPGPAPSAPPGAPAPRGAPAWPAEATGTVDRLRAERRLLLMGALDHAAVNRVCAELMLADGLSAEPIALFINSSGGPADAVLGLIDVITLLRAPLATRGIGRASGTAVVVLASGTGGRSATANTAICLRTDDPLAFDGRADDIQRQAATVSAVWDRIAEQLAAVSKLTAEQAAAALRDGAELSPAGAIAVGIIDDVTRR